MYLFLCTFGPGALTYLIAEKCSGKKSDWVKAFIELIAYSAINMVITAVLLKPFGRFEVVFLPDGTKTVCYGIVTLIIAFAISVITGIVIATVKKKIDLKIQVACKKGASDENQKNK